jgi:hypothetical protein
MNDSIKQALTQGLLAGYAGEAEFKSIVRGGFEMKQSYYNKNGVVYHDEWLPNRTGGGQELVEIEGQKFTRIYAGGLISETALKELEIDENDVISTLINQIKLAGEKTRLNADYEKLDRDWKYSYKVKKQIEEIGLLVGKEKIKYKGQLVFVHYFLLSPIT